jgi:hypothetical protein
MGKMPQQMHHHLLKRVLLKRLALVLYKSRVLYPEATVVLARLESTVHASSRGLQQRNFSDRRRKLMHVRLRMRAVRRA